MKKYLFIILIPILLLSCVTSRGRFQKNGDVTVNEKYDVKDRVYGSASAEKLWIFFIPIGGSSDQGLYNRAYRRALEGKNADGVTSQIVEYKKIKIPLIFITYVHKDLTIRGRAYTIKNK
jgi:uncharacterized membrane protein